MNIDIEKYNTLFEEAIVVDKTICAYKEGLEQYEKKLNNIENEIRKLLPKGYWWTWNIGRIFHVPKKYSIKKVDYYWGKFNIRIKETSCKNSDGEYTFSFKDFIKLDIYKTEEECVRAYLNRPCPKCGNPMGNTTRTWCHKCMNERAIAKEEFEKAHSFRDSKNGDLYFIGYTDELTREKGYHGEQFTIKILDTGEIIKTDNLWSGGFPYKINSKDIKSIKFIKSK